VNRLKKCSCSTQRKWVLWSPPWFAREPPDAATNRGNDSVPRTEPDRVSRTLQAAQARWSGRHYDPNTNSVINLIDKAGRRRIVPLTRILQLEPRSIMRRPSDRIRVVVACTFTLGVMSFSLAANARVMTMKQCIASFRTAKAAGDLTRTTWKEYRRAHICRSKSSPQR